MRHAYHRPGVTDLAALISYAKARKGEQTTIHYPDGRKVVVGDTDGSH